MDLVRLNDSMGEVITRAGDVGVRAGRQLTDGVGNAVALVPRGAKAALDASRRHPVASIAAATVLAGIGAAVWLVRRANARTAAAAKPAGKPATKGNGKAAAAKPRAKAAANRRKAGTASAPKAATKRAARANGAAAPA